MNILPVLLQVEVVIDIPNVPPNFINEFREILENFSLPYQVTDSVKVTDLILTTGENFRLLIKFLTRLLGPIHWCQTVSDFYQIWLEDFLTFLEACSPNADGRLQCQCEEAFLWPCEKCDIYGACDGATGVTCDCIHGFPSDGHFCEPITSKQC